jgi:hypothetical protein
MKNPLAHEEDFEIPSKPKRDDEVETCFIDREAEVEYFVAKLKRALKLPTDQ